MSVLDWFRFPTAALSPQLPSLSSPWSTAELTRFAWSDIFGTSSAPITRDEAMKVPAVVKARALIVGTLSRQPLAKFRGGDKIDADPWMYRSASGVPPQLRTMWTLDDLLFHGTSLWAVERGTRDQIIDAVRVPPAEWSVNSDGQIEVRGTVARTGEVIYFEGPQDGLLKIAADDIRRALAMGSAWGQRVQSPVPLVELHINDPNAVLTDEEQDELIADWERARQAGGTALTPYELDMRVHGTVVADLFVSGRNMSRLDFANFTNLPAAMLDGTTATASLTYSTKEGSRNELVDLSLAYWATPFEARLSQDDVTPAGSRVAFDVEYLTTPQQPTQGPAHQD